MSAALSRGRPSAGRRPSGGVAYATALALMLGGLFATLADVKVAAYALVAGLVTHSARTCLPPGALAVPFSS